MSLESGPKKDIYPLKYASQFEHIIRMLELLPRTGWVQWKIENPENVWEHIVAVRELAIEYKPELGLSDEEFVDLLTMIEIHDWPEALVGDGVILGDEENVDELRSTKKARELAAMKTICANHPQGEEIFALYERYSTGSDRVARLVKQLEKLQAVIKAAEYEKTLGKKGLTDEFVHYTRDLISDSFLTKEFEKINGSVIFIAFLLSNYSVLMV